VLSDSSGEQDESISTWWQGQEVFSEPLVIFVQTTELDASWMKNVACPTFDQLHCIWRVYYSESLLTRAAFKPVVSRLLFANSARSSLTVILDAIWNDLYS
jgi:hypothetical protein